MLQPILGNCSSDIISPEIYELIASLKSLPFIGKLLPGDEESNRPLYINFFPLLNK